MFKFIPDEFVPTFCGCWEKYGRAAWTPSEKRMRPTWMLEGRMTQEAPGWRTSYRDCGCVAIILVAAGHT